MIAKSAVLRDILPINYYSAGRRTQMTDYFGGQTNYSYDALGRLTSLTNPFNEPVYFNLFECWTKNQR